MKVLLQNNVYDNIKIHIMDTILHSNGEVFYFSVRVLFEDIDDNQLKIDILQIPSSVNIKTQVLYDLSLEERV